MSVFDTVAPPQPSAEKGAVRIRRTLAQSFHQIEASLTQVRQIMERHGASEVQSALGADATEVSELYQALKEFCETHKPGASVPEATYSVNSISQHYSGRQKQFPVIGRGEIEKRPVRLQQTRRT